MEENNSGRKIQTLDFDMEALKLETMFRAAHITKLNNRNVKMPVKPSKLPVSEAPTPKDCDDSWESFKSDENSIMDMSSSLDMLDVSSTVLNKIAHRELQKLRQDIVKQEHQKRVAQYRSIEAYREQLKQEAAENFLKKVEAKKRETEEQVRQALEELAREEKLRAEEEKQEKAEVEKRLQEQSVALKREEEKRRVNDCIDSIRANQDRLRGFYEAYIARLRTVDEAQLAKVVPYDEKIKALFAVHDTIIRSMRAGRITNVEVQASAKLCTEFEAIQKEFDAILEADKKEQEHQAAEQQRQQETERQEKANQVQQRDESDHVAAVGTDQFISQENLKRYCELETFRKAYAESIKPLLADDSLKQFRFHCQKAINVPLNAISDVSRDHLMDKFNKLAGLLNGHPVDAGGGVQISASAHPLAIRYCTLLMAKQFVNQGHKLIASCAKQAFPVAAVIVSLWHMFPDFGQLFLAHLYKDCPYLVPYFTPQMSGQSNENYLQCIGYRVLNGVLEKQDMYLERMSGLCRLMAAIFVTRPRRGEKNPFNLQNAWTWLTSFLNMDPLPGICATLVDEFLLMVGWHMQEQYGKQFAKLVHVIRGPYMQKLNRVDEGGSKTRLEITLTKMVESGHFQKPEGLLPNNFW